MTWLTEIFHLIWGIRYWMWLYTYFRGSSWIWYTEKWMVIKWLVECREYCNRCVSGLGVLGSKSLFDQKFSNLQGFKSKLPLPIFFLTKILENFIKKFASYKDKDFRNRTYVLTRGVPRKIFRGDQKIFSFLFSCLFVLVINYTDK